MNLDFELLLEVFDFLFDAFILFIIVFGFFKLRGSFSITTKLELPEKDSHDTNSTS